MRMGTRKIIAIHHQYVETWDCDLRRHRSALSDLYATVRTPSEAVAYVSSRNHLRFQVHALASKIWPRYLSMLGQNRR